MLKLPPPPAGRGSIHVPHNPPAVIGVGGRDRCCWRPLPAGQTAGQASPGSPPGGQARPAGQAGPTARPGLAWDEFWAQFTINFCILTNFGAIS